LFTARSVAAQKFGCLGWALTLAGLRRAGARGFRRRRQRGLGLCGLATFGAPTAPPPALSLPLVPSIRSLTILPAGPPSAAPPGRGPALGTAIARLGMGGMKGLLASLEETPSLPRPTSPLTGPGIAASW